MALVRFLKADNTENTYLRDRVVLDKQIVTYSFGEEATPLAPGDSAGATSIFDVEAIMLDRTDLSYDQMLELTLDDGSKFLGIIRVIDIDRKTNRVKFSMDGLANRFNTNVDLPPQLSRRFDISIRAWAALVNIPSSMVYVDPRIAARIISFPGFKKINLWDAVKQMCAAYGYIAYSTGSSVGFSLPGEIELKIVEPSTTVQTIARMERARTVVVKNYNSKTALNQIIFKATDVYEVKAGETLETTATIEGSIQSVNNPTAYAQMNLTEGNFGQYVVTGSDGYIIAPQLWRDYGGKITAAVGTEYNEIKLSITGANLPDRSPFRVSEGGEDRPSLWFSGQAIVHEPVDMTFYTGDDTVSLVEQPPVVDSPFIATELQARDRGVFTAGVLGGPEITLTITGMPQFRLIRHNPDGTDTELPVSFGYFAGALLRYGDAIYRVLTVTYTPRAVDIVLAEHTTIADFNAVWAGKTIADFDAVVAGMTVGQFLIRPLMTRSA